MTVSEIHKGVRTQFQSVSSQTLDNFLPEEIDYYVNRAVRRIVNSQRTHIRHDREGDERAEEAQDNLRTLVETHIATSSDISTLNSIGRGYTVDLSSGASDYEYFLHGHIIGSDYQANCRFTTYPKFHEHVPTTENDAIFREPPAIEKEGEIWFILSKEMGQPQEFTMAYLRPPKRMDSSFEYTIEVLSDTGSNDPSIEIDGNSYTVVWDTDVPTTVQKFVDEKGPQVRQDTGLVTSEGIGEIVFTGYNSHLSGNEINEVNPSDPIATLTTGSSTPTQNIDLPEHTHQMVIDQTVQLLRSDLPQASNRQSSE